MSTAARRLSGRAIPVRPSLGLLRLTYVDRWLALTALVILLALNIALPVWKVAGVPVRSAFAGGIVAASVLLYPQVAASALQDSRRLLFIVAGILGIGIFVSLANDVPVPVISQAILEMPLQAAVTILAAFVLAKICGARATMIAVIGTIGVSGLVAVAQAVGVDGAWDLRTSISDLKVDPLTGRETTELNRPVGLSFSPIQLATQLCLAFAAFTAVRDKERSPRFGPSALDPAVLPALMALIILAIACGTRSPVLGGVVFFALYAVQRRGSTLALLVLVSGFTLYLAWPLIMDAIAATQPRVARTDDRSSAGRVSLFSFGVLLFLNNPLGYGFGFSPVNHWSEFWHQLYELPSAELVRSEQLHNYFLNMLNTYGIGLVLLIPAIVVMLMRNRASLIFFLPYVGHIMFHNSGPLWNDMIIWFVVAAISVAGEGFETSGNLVGRGRRNPGVIDLRAQSVGRR